MTSPNVDPTTRHAAASYGHIEVLEYLISQGVFNLSVIYFSDHGGTELQEGTSI